MTWKNMIRKEISGKDMKDILDDEDYNNMMAESNKEFETGERGSDNTVIRDRDDTFDPMARLRKDPDLEVELNKALDDFYSLIQPFVDAGVLDYDKHLMKFTKIVDVIMNKIINR